MKNPRPSTSPSGQLKSVTKRFKFQPIGIFLRDYNVELLFVNPDVADEFLLHIEQWDNENKLPHEQVCWKEGHEYKFLPIELMTSVDDAMKEVVARESIQDPDLPDYSIYGI